MKRTLWVLWCLTCLPGAAEASPAFASTYTDFKKDCRDAFPKSDIEEGGDMPLLCKGPGGYSIYIYFSAASSHIMVIKGAMPEPAFDLFLGLRPFSSDFQEKVEWRLADKRPFAVIYRNSGELLLVKGLEGFPQIDASIDARKEPQANERARAAADTGYLALREKAH